MSSHDTIPKGQDRLIQLEKCSDLAVCPAFANLTDAQRNEALELATVSHFRAHDTCFAEGDKADSFYLLVSGVVRIVRTTPEGEQVIVLHVMPGELFGMSRSLGNDRYMTSASAIVDGLALRWPSSQWDRFAQDFPDFRTATRQIIGTRMKEMQNKVVALATQKVEQRIAHAVQNLVQIAGMPTQDGIEIDFPISRQDLSEMTGTTLHSVSRYMSKWQKDGIVKSSRRRVVVRRPDALPL